MKRNIEVAAIIYNFLLLISNCVLVIILPDMLDRVVSGFMLGIQILLIIFWLCFFDKPPNH